jgi:hypothetical protein
MKIAFILCISSIIWLPNCAGINRKNNADKSIKAWQAVIEVLNQTDSDPILLDADLTKLYSDEQNSIAFLWSQHHHVSTSRNHFFHDHIRTANEQAFAGLNEQTGYTKNNLPLAADIIALVEAHDVASSTRVREYQDGEQIGFCFARAMLVHYLLLKVGIAPSDIKKIFALGEFFIGGQFWNFHVAIMVRSMQGFIVVDPLYGEPAMLDDWQRNVAMVDVKQSLSRARFYVTDPRKFMPTTGAYTIELISPPELWPYFYDLGPSMASMKVKSREQK